MTTGALPNPEASAASAPKPEAADPNATPILRVGLYSYGATRYEQAKGWVRKDLDLTNDLDEAYKQLTALKTGGGTELVALHPHLTSPAGARTGGREPVSGVEHYHQPSVPP